MHNVGQYGAGEAPLMLDELAGEHGEEHDADKVSRARRQTRDQVVDGTGGQVDWRSSQVERWHVWFRHPTSIAKSDCFLLLNW